MASALGARDLYRLVRNGIDVKGVHAHVRKPFRFLLCGDPALIAQMRTLLLSGHDDDSVPPDAAACIETITPNAPLITNASEVRAVIFLGQTGDRGASLETLRTLKVPILALYVDPQGVPYGPVNAPAPGTVGEYIVPAISKEPLRARVFVHLVEASKGVEIAVGRRLPPLRETVAAKLTRDAANNALKVALASALVDHIPVVGVVLGAFASAGDMVAITGFQMMLLLHIEATYGKDPDVQRMWKLLPVIGGGFGWRTLARELVGFVPVAGVAIKGAIAYAGTIVVGESVTFFLEHGSHMSKAQASQLYDRTKEDALRFARELATRFKRK
ncbi:MAG TPA: hypothetical protein VMF11_15125 [Candidatus Baltobacteraceae bacterium]|nr:hypothetical protein [Candidatus Baltobacteraceae bacterium]